ncbi:MAG: hypothetical protein KJN82_03665, partial [Bacteroidia bacterium]|nr:hypothetical protein [Bacteroidia bacterium]
RHHILFSFLGLVGTYSLINSHKIKFRYSFIVLLVAGYFISNKIVDIRRHGFVNYLLGEKIEKYEKVTKDYSTDKTTVYLNYVVDYYEEEDLRYGQSTLAIIFFWVPRKFWPEKPPQFGYWFIRDYLGGQKGFGDKFSAPASYLGVPYSDFAIVGVILISLFIGWLSNFVDEYFRKNSVFKSNKQVVILSFCLASFFFLPRQLNQFFSKFIVIVILLNFLFYINRISLVYKNDK